ncbi:hypothetical protein [Phocaeicola vulgatus]|uniref:hypothetical protein n=1 Tax=Phocaeicola vulgatus TaxID=821 RepID=UPI003567CD85
MILKLNSISIEGSESSLGRQENTAPDVIIQKVSITPEKFKDDVEALVKYINPEKPDVPLNKNDAFQKVQKRRVQKNGERDPI